MIERIEHETLEPPFRQMIGGVGRIFFYPTTKCSRPQFRWTRVDTASAPSRDENETASLSFSPTLLSHSSFFSLGMVLYGFAFWGECAVIIP